MKKVFVILACVIVALARAALVVVYSTLSPTQQSQGQLHIERTVIVDRVVDGDTIVLQGGEKVRFWYVFSFSPMPNLGFQPTLGMD